MESEERSVPDKTVNLYGQWDACKFFERLTRSNLMARNSGFVFCKVSGLEGFEEALHQMQTAQAFVCVSDTSDGVINLNSTPSQKRVNTIFLAMRHPADDMNERERCLDLIREIFRQFMSVLVMERVKLTQTCIYLDPRISFVEIEKYFFSGCACAYFNIGVETQTSLVYEAGEWYG